MNSVKNKPLQTIKDFIFFPLRVFFEHKTVSKLGLTSLQDERFNVCLPFVTGNVLDIGCGKENKFIRKLGYGVGLDAYFKGADVVAEAEKMPFSDKSFQTITVMVTLHCIKDGLKAMQEINRVLADDGLLLILENHPFLNTLRYALVRRWNPYQGMRVVGGFTKKDIVKLAEASQFKLIKTKRYVYGLGVMYVLAKNYVS